MRLIDAYALIKRFETIQKQEDAIGLDFVAIIDEIKEQPTAYDVDKVVEQLEELGKKMSESKSMQKCGKSSPENHRYYKAVSVKLAIEIVKGGGVDEQSI